MSLGVCNQCGCRIGERTANGVYRPFPISAQVIMEYSYPNRTATTKVHVAVCKTCASSPDGEKLEVSLLNDVPFNDFKVSAPDAVLSRVVEEVIV